MLLNEDEVDTLKKLITDRGWEYALASDDKKVLMLAKRLGMDRYVEMYEPYDR